MSWGAGERERERLRPARWLPLFAAAADICCALAFNRRRFSEDEDDDVADEVTYCDRVGPAVLSAELDAAAADPPWSDSMLACNLASISSVE